jgi:hypothetical protein
MDSNRKGFAENWGDWDKLASEVYRKNYGRPTVF